MAELITISVPTHRRPTLLLQTLRPCFAQDYRPLEIDVGDDSPGNESQLLVKSNPRNHSLVKSLYHLGLAVTRRFQKLRRFWRFYRPNQPQHRALDGLVSIGTTVEDAESALNSSWPASHGEGEGSLTITLVSQNVCYGHGQGRANLELVREALRQGHRVNIVASEVDRIICNDPNVRLYHLDVSMIRTQLLRDAFFDRQARRVVRNLRAESDIIHVNGAVVTAASDVNTAHFVHGSHAKCRSSWLGLVTSPYKLYQYGYTLLNAIMERRCFMRAKSVIAVSQTVATDLLACGVDRKRLFVIYNGIDLDEFAPGQADRAALGLPPDVLLAVFVGDIKGNRKNLDTVLRALVSNANVHLAVLANHVGTPGPALAQALGIADRVHFLGERGDVAAIMRSADMLVFPSRYEPFGMVILEALASGLPVIASRAAGASEILEPGSGLIVNDPNDSAELSHCIAVLAADAELRREMGRLGRIVAERYSWKHMAEQYIARYESLATVRRGTPSTPLPGAAGDEPVALFT